jgi:beta-lactamase regulating signal transducer with metallopeptidase domain
MSLSLPTFDNWLLHSAAGGSLLLLVAWKLTWWCRQPARRQRLGEMGLCAALAAGALGFLPAWLIVPVWRVPADRPPQPSTVAAAVMDEDNPMPNHTVELPRELTPEEWQPFVPAEEDTSPIPIPQWRGVSPAHPTAEARQVMPEAAPAVNAWLSWRNAVDWLVIAYLALVMVMLGRWLLGSLSLRRLIRTAQPAPEEVAALFAELAQRQHPYSRLLVSNRLRLPASCGLLRPTVLLPANLCAPEQEPILRWVFAHELTHLQRSDAWSCLLFALGHAVYFYLPWFWWLRRQVRLCQEYIADAAAAELAANPEDYAQFLLSLSMAPAAPQGTTGVMGKSSDLFRRVTMLLQDSATQLERRCPRWWSLAALGGLLALAVLVSGVSLRAQAETFLFDDTPAKPAQERPRREGAKQDQGNSPLHQLPENQDAGNGAPPLPPLPQVNPNQFQPLQQQMQRQQQEMFRNMQNQMAFGGFGNMGWRQEGRLGILVQRPDATLIDQLDLPKNEGLVITQVEPGSAAAKAGLKAHDILLDFNGKPVTHDIPQLLHRIHEAKADTALDAVVLRKGKKETIKAIKLAELPANQGQNFFPGQPGGFGFQGGGFGNQGGNLMLPPGIQGQGLGGNFGMGGGIGLGAPGVQSVFTSITRRDDRFTTRQKEGSLIITLTGSVTDGKTKMSQIQIQDGRDTHQYTSVEDVPEQYRDKVKNLLDLNDKSNSRIELKGQPDSRQPRQAQ